MLTIGTKLRSPYTNRILEVIGWEHGRLARDGFPLLNVVGEENQRCYWLTDDEAQEWIDALDVVLS